ncbi:adenylate/guanylate cyclase domain-containing protein [Thermodesulfobacteriota bacterium]
MKCPDCQSENRDGVKFCEECGTKMEMVCPHCSAKIPLGKKFCGECGHKLEAPPPEQPSPEPAIDYDQPQSYTPKFMAEKILTTRSSIEGERKLVTVFFADVANYTGMSEKLDPEDVHQVMDGCFKILMNEIHKYEGTINQFTGDGVMALFGAPLAHEDHAQRACFASLAIQRAMAGYGAKLMQEYGADFKMRIGLNSGSVVVGAIGDDLRMDYTAVGDTTNLAARMEGLAQPGTILVTANTHRLSNDYFVLKSLGEVEVKGKAEPQEIFELTGVSDVVTRLDASVAKGLTKYIGRQDEMRVLTGAFEKVRTGLGQIVGIIGEAGVGKSRLIYELRKDLAGEHHYLEGRCLQFGSSIPFLPLLDILKACFGIEEGDPETSINEKMNKRLRELHENLIGAVPAYQDLLSLPIEDAGWDNLDPKEKRLRTFEAIRDLFIHLSQEKPLLLVFDDLHWADKTSEEFLDYLIGWLANTPILLLLLYRPEFSHTWGSKSYYNKIGLDQLSGDSSAELVESILKEGTVAPEIRELILNRAAGNPLFMEELTRTLLENGSIVKQDHNYILSQEASTIDVPGTVQGIISARMDRLEDNLKRIMQVASVIGRDFAFRILQLITGMQEELKSGLLNLQGLEFIYEKRLFPELEYIFRHALTQEVAYNSLLLNRRKELHEKIGAAIEQIYADRLDEFFDVLALHYSKSEHPEKAYHYLKLSGDKAMRTNSAWEALGYYKEALFALGRLTETEEVKKKKLETLHAMLIPMIILGLPEESLSFLEQGEMVAKELGDEKSLMRFYSNIGLYHSNRGDYSQGRLYSGKAFEEAEKMQDAESMARSAPDLCLSYLAEGEYPKVIDVAFRTIDILEKTDNQTETFGGPANVYPATFALCAFSKSMLGEFEEAVALSEKGVQVATEVGNQTTMGLCEFYAGSVLLNNGDLQRAIGFFEKSIQDLEEVNFLQPLALSLSGLGLARAFLGNPEQGISDVERGLEIGRKVGVGSHSSTYTLSKGICLYESGDLDAAQKSMEEALNVSREYSEKHTEGKALIWLGRAMGKVEQPSIDQAEEFIRTGLKILETLGTRPDVAIAHFFLGEFYSDCGRQDEARENLNRAEAMFKEMGMDYWLKAFSALSFS